MLHDGFLSIAGAEKGVCKDIPFNMLLLICCVWEVSPVERTIGGKASTQQRGERETECEK
jgi:hypothetical protein